MEIKKYLFYFILLLSIAGCAKDKSNINDDEKIVAKIGKDYVVTLKDLKEYVANWNYGRKFRERSEAYKNALDALIFNQLKRFDFFDRKLNENQDLMKEIRRVINYELINKYFEKEFMEKYVNEEKAAEAYKEMDKEIFCYDVILPVSQNPSKEKLDSLKALALEIEKGLSNKNDVNNLIKMYSLKNSIINNEKTVTWSQSMIDPVAYVAFKLQKGYTRVFQSYDGFHVVKVIDIKKIKLEPFEKIKDQIISDLKKGYYQVYNKEYDDFVNMLVNRSSIKWNERGLEQIIKWSKNERFYAGVYKDTIQNAVSNGRNFEILSYNNGKVDLKEYLRLLDEVIILSPNVVLNSENIKQYILDAVDDDNVIKAAQKIGLEKEIVNPYTKNSIIKDRLAYLYNQAVIEGSIPEPTPEALHKFYEDQKDSIFHQLQKINLYARIYSDSTKAAADIQEINKGIPFEKVSSSWYVKTYFRDRNGSLKSYRSQEPPYLAEAGFKLGLNEAAGPIEFYDSTKVKQFAVIKCIRILPEKQLTYDEVKGKRIEEEFKNYYRQKISDEIEANLKKKYGVEIYEDTLYQAIASN